jgi:hypothetical protein
MLLFLYLCGFARISARTLLFFCSPKRKVSKRKGLPLPKCSAWQRGLLYAAPWGNAIGRAAGRAGNDWAGVSLFGGVIVGDVGMNGWNA